ncbi:hypothetical protein Rxycam_01604 [Rubrobacter xylanophilus DSM 9941]|uniref:YncE family protein n=1 Tax=Rubrobacter xylanophilus TaxID=49319 RepID=UPI001C63BF50|nr:hypothetical protein [Rubrobacter xylanophilus]QYJ15776.1 hypothetical protein Rxycam_01604 [Rubrobacter xylanophilus DSM 9941]
MTRPTAAALVPLALLLLVLAGCGAPRSFGGGPVRVLEAPAPLRDPVWAPHERVLLALQEDGRRLLRLDPEDGSAARSRGLAEEAGSNMAPDPEEPGHLYIPQPGAGRVLLVDPATLEVRRRIEIGGAPEQAEVHPTSDTLLLLQEGGGEVIGVDLITREPKFRVRVGGGPETFIRAAEESQDPAFWVVGPGGVAHYRGDPPRLRVERGVRVAGEALDSNLEASQMAYAGGARGRALLLEGDPEGLLEGGLEVIRRTPLGEPAEYVESKAKEELRVYAATRGRLVVLDSETLEVEAIRDFGRALRERRLGGVGLSGMTVGEERVYLTLRGEPYLVSVPKPG